MIYDSYIDSWKSALTVFLLTFHHSPWINFDVIICRFCWSLGQLILNRLTYRSKDFRDIVIILGTALYKIDPIFIPHRLTLRKGDLPLILLTIRFIPDYNLDHGFRLRLVDLLDPILKIIKRFLICHRIYKNNSSSSFIVGLGDSLKSFLAGSIPYLHLDFDAINVNGLDLEVDSDRGHMWHLVLFVHISE